MSKNATPTMVEIPTFRALAACIRANAPVFLLSHPGQSKSATLTALTTSWGWHIETIIGSNRDRTDFLGTMIEIDGEVHYSTLGWASRCNSADRAVVFMDELTTSSADVQKAMLRVIQERYVGETRLGDHVAIVAAGNPPASAADGFDLEAPVANRFVHLDWIIPLAEWRTGMTDGWDQVTYPSLDELCGTYDPAWAASAKALVMSFLEAQPQWLAPNPPADPAEAGRAWPSMRMWTVAACVLGHLAADDVMAHGLILEGCVGKAARVAFLEYVSRLDLPSPVDMLSKPDTIGFATMRPDQVFASMSALRSYLTSRDLDKKVWTQAVNTMVVVAQSGRPDVGWELTSWLLNRIPTGATIPSGIRDAYMDLMVDIGRFAAKAA